MVKIRAYREDDFDEICSWWKDRGEVPPDPGMMITDGTFVLELHGIPVMTLTVLTTQSKEISYYEGYCARPGLKKELRHYFGNLIWQHGFEYLKKKGFKRVIIFTHQDSLARRYEDMGMRENLNGLISLGRQL